MNNRQYREWRKQRLLSQIQQQRVDLAQNTAVLLEKTERIDRGWQALFGMRKFMAIGASVVAIYGIRHPSKLILWSRRALGAWGTLRLLRKTLSTK